MKQEPWIGRPEGRICCLIWIIVLCAFSLGSCARVPHIIGYEITTLTPPPQQIGKISILPFADERPKQEREGVRAKLLAFSSRDRHFSQSVPSAIQETLSQELRSAGFTVGQEAPADYIISGTVKHFQVIMAPAKITFLPYLGSVSTLWAKDDFTIALSIYIKMTDRQNRLLIDQTFDVSEGLKLPTGLLNLARYSRGFNYKLKLLDEALKDVMGQIREEVLTKTK